MFQNSRIPHPIEKGVVRVPLVMQMESLECGAAALAMIMHYYGKWISLEQARVDCGVSTDGSNAKGILTAARRYGMNVKAWRMEPELLLAEGPFPCIIHWGFYHFVVLCGFKGDRAVLNDPARGRITVNWEEFDREFTGVCLTIEPGESFTPSGKRKSVFSYAKTRLKGLGTAVIFVILTTTISSLIGILPPLFNRIFLDRLLSGRNPEWLTPFMAAFCAMILLDITVRWIAAIYSLRIQGRIAMTGNASYLWKILRLPMQFFSQRFPTDIADRQIMNGEISNTLVNTFAPLLLNTGMMVFYLVVMIRYSRILSLIGISAVFLNLAVSAMITSKLVNLARVQQKDRAKLSSATMSCIDRIETIKSMGAENAIFGRWSGYQARVNTQSVRFNRLNLFVGSLPAAVTVFSNLTVLGLGVMLVIRNQFTIGMVMAFQGFLSSFIMPASSLISAGQSLQEMTAQMERVDDVMSYPEDPCFERLSQADPGGKLTGNIELNHVTFGYSRLGEPQIRDVSLTIEPGQHIALTGRTGCGKSTLAKLISGLLQPWSGSISFDGIPLSGIHRDVFTRSVSVVDQDITLFEATISENIRMWDNSVNDSDVILAARDTGIIDEILKWDRGFSHVLSEEGRELSGGQRQKLEIARALSCNPRICILDEATSALDPEAESEIIRAIRRRGITCIVIAHRLSAIRDCDRILVMEQGRIVEQGTHEELIVLGSVYTSLIGSE